MTPFALTSLQDLAALCVDDIIDVRAPSEHAEDHVPGAINLPVLDDAERARVGTLYKQHSPFDARKIGGALVAQNTARHLQGPLAGHRGDWQPLVYCWRGGQRSGAFATILSQVGWRVRLLDGGYKKYRRLVVGMLYDSVLPHRLRLIDGGTGTAKTRLLAHLKAAGGQVVDLEDLARHRGSLFGQMATAQPSQKMFESHLAQAFSRLDPNCITWVEAESSKIGARVVPPALWQAMQIAPRVRLDAPVAARARFLVRAYADLTNDSAVLMGQIDRLRPYHAQALIDTWQGQVATADWERLAADLIAQHYDPRYAKSAARADVPVTPFALSDLEEETLEAAARRLISETPQA